MTNQEVIKILKEFRNREGNSGEDIVAFDVAINAVNNTKVINMTEKYYDYVINTLKDVISDIAVNLAFTTGADREYDKGKMDSYVDIMHMIYEDFMENFEG